MARDTASHRKELSLSLSLSLYLHQIFRSRETTLSTFARMIDKLTKTIRYFAFVSRAIYAERS